MLQRTSLQQHRRRCGESHTLHACPSSPSSRCSAPSSHLRPARLADPTKSYRSVATTTAGRCAALPADIHAGHAHSSGRPVTTAKPTTEEHYDVVIVGSGPAGSTFARKLVDSGLNVVMLDAGPQGAKVPGSHNKNAYKFQRDVNSFASVIRAALTTLSVPTNFDAVPTLDPFAYNPPAEANGFVRGNQNPFQSVKDNLPAASATYTVGGMSTHWTASCPRPHPRMEANYLFPGEASYKEAETILRVNQETFMPYSVRDRVLNKVLRKAWAERTGVSAPIKPGPGQRYPDGPQPLPLAARRRHANPEMVEWTGANTILGERLLDLAANSSPAQPGGQSGRFSLRDNHVCMGLEINSAGTTVESAIVFDAVNGCTIRMSATRFVVAAGTILTPQILWKSLSMSGIAPESRLPALGRYLTEQPMAFSQIIWGQDTVVNEFFPLCHHDMSVDPVPISMTDPDPNQWIPVSDGRPWHAQIHRDAFAYGDTAPNVDNRMVVDLRFFGIVQQRWENRVEFHSCAQCGIVDLFGMPQPTFHYSYSPEEKETMHKMMAEMEFYANQMGGYLPGSGPQFMKPGLSLHIHGSTRVGLDASDSVVNKFGQVHGFTNLFLGGNGLIPRAIACNPTLTTVSYALEASAYMVKRFEADKAK